MENASKALIMAGSILIAIMVIGLLVYGYGQISDLEQTRADAEVTDTLAEYMRRFEQYNRGPGDQPLYGSEVLSLANLQADYNFMEADRQDIGRLEGYSQITITVEITNEISQQNMPAGEHYFSVGTHDISEILSDYEDLSGKIDGYKEPKYTSVIDGISRSAVYYSTRSNLEIAIDFGLPVEPDDYDALTGRDVADDKLEELANHPTEGNSDAADLIKAIEKYLAYKGVYDTFRNGKRFTCNEITYNEANGRIARMEFVEV